MNHIVPILNYKLAEIYYEAYAETNRLFNENQRLLAQQNTFVTQQINALKAKTKFLQEIYKDISQISKSDVLRQSTCTNLQRIRIELDEVFYNFISQIDQGLMVKNFNDVSGNYICARYALSQYIFALVLEYVVAGLIDNESMKALKDKIEKTFEKFNQTTESFRGQLSLIQNNNAQTQQSIWQSPFYGWYYDGSAHYHPNQQNEFNRLNNENAHIEYISNNVLSYFDIKRDREALFNLIEAPEQYLQNIVITHEEK
ncbi:cell division protein FtsB-like protein [Helicobacter pylori]|nr:cell division protein FtsB-like protein [Helicobacter pylori]BAW53701.1 cell division protein FtsB-like protein [Helicobacter pylori]